MRSDKAGRGRPRKSAPGKKRKMVEIRPEVFPGVEEAVRREGGDNTEWVNQAIREKLSRMGLWPITHRSGGDDNTPTDD